MSTKSQPIKYQVVYYRIKDSRVFFSYSLSMHMYILCAYMYMCTWCVYTAYPHMLGVLATVYSIYSVATCTCRKHIVTVVGYCIIYFGALDWLDGFNNYVSIPWPFLCLCFLSELIALTVDWFYYWESLDGLVAKCVEF